MGIVLNSVTNHTYLGVELNNKLNWADHVNNTATKANKVLGLLRRNLYSCPQKVKETAYKALVRPKLEYCASVWDPYKQDHKNRLEAVQRRAARFVCRDSRRTSSVSTMIMQQSIVRRTIGPPGIVRHGWVIYHTFLTKGTVLEAFGPSQHWRMSASMTVILPGFGPFRWRMIL